MRKLTFLYHMKAISFFFFFLRNDFWIDFRLDIFHWNQQRRGLGRGKGGNWFCVLLPALTKVWLSMIPLQLNLLLSDTSRCTVACQTLVRRDHTSHGQTIKGQSLGLHRKGEQADAAQTGGFLFKASWSGFILQEFFYLSEFGQQNPQRVLTGATSWRSKKGAGEFQLPKYIF